MKGTRAEEWTWRPSVLLQFLARGLRDRTVVPSLRVTRGHRGRSRVGHRAGEELPVRRGEHTSSASDFSLETHPIWAINLHPTAILGSLCIFPLITRSQSQTPAFLSLISLHVCLLSGH